MKAYFVTLARYNQWANARLYAELEKLTPAQLVAKSAVNFGSILAIANHLLLTDRLWVNRFTGRGEPVTSVDAVPYPDLDALAEARLVEETRLLEFVEGLDPAVLGGTLRYVTTEGTPCALPFGLCLLHCLNHQTHHRGQMHGLLGPCGIKARDIDLLGYRREAQAG